MFNLVDIEEISRVVKERKRTYLSNFDNFHYNDNEVDSDDAVDEDAVDDDDVVDDDHEETAPAGDGAAGGRLEGDGEGGPRAEYAKRAAFKTLRQGKKMYDVTSAHMGDLGRK